MSKEENKLSFEEAIKELEEVINQLESGQLNLDDSISKFEKGVELSKYCNNILENAEKKITILTNKDGNIVEENFNIEEE